MEDRECEVNQDNKDRKVYLVSQDKVGRQDGQVHQAEMANVELDHKDQKDKLDHVDHQDLQEKTDKGVLMENQVNKDQLAGVVMMADAVQMVDRDR